MKGRRIRAFLSLIANGVIVYYTFMSLMSYYATGAQGNMEGLGAQCFRYFTVDSNALCGLSALFMLPGELRALFKGGRPGRAAQLFKFVGTASVTLTLMTVLVFLGPVFGYDRMFVGKNFYLHLTGPLTAIVSYCFLDAGRRPNVAQTLLGVLPTLIYAFVYFTLVLKLRLWKDFYGFNAGGRWYISFPAMVLGSLLLCYLLRALRGKREH